MWYFADSALFLVEIKEFPPTDQKLMHELGEKGEDEVKETDSQQGRRM